LTYAQSVKFLYSLQRFGMKFGLEGIDRLLDMLERPEKNFRSVHIAGTNGKGSTAAMIAAIFTAAGYRTGLFTSPHLLKFNERIRVDGIPIHSGKIARLTTRIHSGVLKNKCTFFEAATAIAFKYFSDSKVDIAVVECGLGGRLDSTNVLRPVVSVITSVGLEHTEILGRNIRKIAFEKGGIIKKGVPCVSAVKDRSAEGVVKRICRERDSEYIRINTNDISVERSSLRGLTIYTKRHDRIRISLPGEHQATNALLAIGAVQTAAAKLNCRIKDSSIRKGLKNIQKYSGIFGRLSVIGKSPAVIVDVAHNPDAVKALSLSLGKMNFGKMRVVFGIMKDKDYRRSIKVLRRITDSAYLVEAGTERSRRTAELSREFRRYGIRAKEFPTVKAGIAWVLGTTDRSPVLVTGSHFVVGEAIACLRREKYLTINQ
jgi:dihydrofolate synthase/folylpolyglutamate synthase